MRLGRPLAASPRLQNPFDQVAIHYPAIIDMNGQTLAPDSSGPSIFSAIQEQLGLKLESASSAEVLVIDHVEKPSEN